MGCVYLARCNVNGKGYVGKSKYGIEFRKSGHQKDSENRSPLLFHRAIRKHGWDSFEWTILYEDDDNDREWLGWWEQKFIRELKTKTPNGYNMTDGGDGGDVFSGRKHTVEAKEKMRKAALSMSDDTKRKIGIASRGRRHSEETKEKMSESQKKRRPDSDETRIKKGNGRRGKPVSEETKKKISLSKIGKKQTLESNAKRSSTQKGRTYEEIHGIEKAAWMKYIRTAEGKKKE